MEGFLRVREMKKKLTLFIIWTVLTLSLAACGKNSGNQTGVSAYVYRAEEVVMEEIEDGNTISDFIISGEKMYVIGNIWDETVKETYIISKNMDGSDAQTIKYPLSENQSLNAVEVGTDGSLYGILDEYFESEDADGNYIFKENFYLIRFDAEGEIWRQQLNDENSADYYSILGMCAQKDGSIAVIDKNRINPFSADGEMLEKIALEKEVDNGTLIALKDGSFLLNYYEETSNGYTLSKIDNKTGKFSENFKVPGNSDSYSYYAGDGYDLLLVGSSGVYGYNLGAAENVQLMNYVDSDLNTSYIYAVTSVSKTEFYGMASDDMTGETMLYKYSKVDEKDIVPKKVLTLASDGIYWEVRNQVVKFNKSNPDYRIQIIDYSEYNTNEDFSAGLTKLNTDIASGKVPDIVMLENGMPTESYISKGLFEDLYPFIDKDEELKREDFFPNVLSAFEKNGKLYQLVPRFTIYTIAGKTEDVGAEYGWTLEELNELLASKPEGTQIFEQNIRSNMMDYSIAMSGEQFINWETGECRFDSEAFILLLEFLKQFPEEYDESVFTDSYWRSYDAMWRDGKILLYMTYLDGFLQYNNLKKGVYGTDITLKGFPTENRNGSAIVSNLTFAMSAKSKEKEGIWQFLRYFLTDEFQSTIENGWPLSLKQVEVLAEAAKEKPFYLDENGNKIEYDSTYYLDGVEVAIPPMTQEEIDEVLDFVKTVNQPYSQNATLINIISEEAAPYFNGQKNAQEVSKIIQSRVQIYVNENR